MSFLLEDFFSYISRGFYFFVGAFIFSFFFCVPVRVLKFLFHRWTKNLAAASLKRPAFRLSFSSHLNYTLSE